MTNLFICQLPLEQQDEILVRLLESGIDGEDLQNALDSRVCDLEEILY